MPFISDGSSQFSLYRFVGVSKPMNPPGFVDRHMQGATVLGQLFRVSVALSRRRTFFRCSWVQIPYTLHWKCVVPRPPCQPPRKGMNSVPLWNGPHLCCAWEPAETGNHAFSLSETLVFSVAELWTASFDGSRDLNPLYMPLADRQRRMA